MSTHQCSVVVKEKENATISAEQFLNYCTKHLRPTFVEILKHHLGLNDIKTHQWSRDSTEFKQLALRLYFLSPLAYKSLFHYMNLPSRNELLELTKKWKVEAGMGDRFVFQVLQCRSETLTKDEKDCIICADEMSIQRFLFHNRTTDCIMGVHHSIDGSTDVAANKAVIFMARGINSNWRQPLAYFFIAKTLPAMDLKEMLENIILNMHASGFRVLGFVSSQLGSQESNFYRLYQLLGVTPAQPFFTVSQRKIFFLFDVPHLLKSTRDNFLAHTFKFKGEEIRREHVDALYAFDKDRPRRIVSKLTDAHLNPKNKSCTLHAAQLFSNAVVMGFECMLMMKAIPERAHATIDFIEMMDKLFDVLNSQTYSAKLLNRPFTKSAEQMAVLQQAKDFFSSVQIVDHKNSTRSARFIDGWLVTIEAVVGLYDELQCPKMCTMMLNKEPLEDLIGNIFVQKAHSKKPTCIQFKRAFKENFRKNCIDFNCQFQCRASKCVPDFDKLFLNYREADMDKIRPFVEAIQTNNSILEDDCDYTTLELPEENAHEYVCGYYLKKCFKVHQCQICEVYAKSEENLCVVPPKFCEYIHKLDEKFRNVFPLVVHLPIIGLRIISELKNINFVHPCLYFPSEYLISLFVRFNIFTSLKSINRHLKVPENKEKKMSILMNL